MKSNHSNMPNTTNLSLMAKGKAPFSLKNIAILLVIGIFTASGLWLNSLAVQNKMSIYQVLVNVTQSVLEHGKFEIAMSQEDKRQLREEMRQQWSANPDTGQTEKTWKQMGAGEREQIRRDMAQTSVIDLPPTAAGPVNPAMRR